MKHLLSKSVSGKIGASLAVFFIAASPLAARGDALTLSVTPPLFQLNVAPGDLWTSSIKVVNVNPADLTVYASVTGFAASDEEGHGRFIPLVNVSDNPDELANWITLDHQSLTIPTGQAAEFGFTIKVPKGASPGGHYAAIMIGTQPANQAAQGTTVSVGSFVTSLIFMSVKGDIKEEGDIKEFSTDQPIYPSPDAKLSLTFENTGNVHVHPEGQIDIYNSWGVKQATIPVNQTTFFGTVLPSSSRKFGVEWKGEDTFFDIGKYTAVATLTYGDLARHNVSSTVTFWVFPATRVFAVVGGTLFFLFILIFSIKLYIRRALALEMKRRGGKKEVTSLPPLPRYVGERNEMKIEKILLTPIAEGVVDLRKARAEMQRGSGRRALGARSPFGSLLRKYVAFLILFPLCILGILWIAAYVRETFDAQKTFEIRVDNPDRVVPIANPPAQNDQ